MRGLDSCVGERRGQLGEARLEPLAAGRLTGKIAVITGAAGNLGGHIVRHYLPEGATVVMTGRSAERIEAATAALRVHRHVQEQSGGHNPASRYYP